MSKEYFDKHLSGSLRINDINDIDDIYSVTVGLCSSIDGSEEKVSDDKIEANILTADKINFDGTSLANVVSKTWLNNDPVTIGDTIQYLLNKKLYDEVTQVIVDKLQNKKKKLVDEFVEYVSYSDTDSYIEFKQKVDTIKKLVGDSRELSNLSVKELENALGGKHSIDAMLLKNKIEEIVQEDTGNLFNKVYKSYD